MIKNASSFKASGKLILAIAGYGANRHLHFPEGIKHFTKLLNGFLIVSVRFHSLEPIQFLIVIIFDFLADGG